MGFPTLFPSAQQDINAPDIKMKAFIAYVMLRIALTLPGQKRITRGGLQ